VQTCKSAEFGTLELCCFCRRCWFGTAGQGRTSFLKKRSKKLFSVTINNRPGKANSLPDAMDKSFLVLFFKKEHTFFFLADRLHYYE
jgi:hypothetical protein